MPKRVILHYTGSVWDGSGVHAVVRQLAQTVRGRVVLGVAPGYRAEKSPRLHAWRGPAVEADKISLTNLVRAWFVAWRVKRWLRGGAHRIFHGHTRAGLLVALWLHFLGAPRVAATVHVFGSQRWFYRWARFCLGERLVWLSPAMKRYYGYREDGWEGCMPNGLASSWSTESKGLPVNRQPLRVGGAGMIVPWKRWDLVLEALRRLPAGVAVEFFHLGGPTSEATSQQYAADLRAEAEKPDLAGKIHWLGWRDSSTSLLESVDVVVVPSDGEPFSMVALEAWFAGVPVIATRGGGPEDFIREGENGWLVAPGDAVKLAERLARCAEPAAWRGLRQDPGRLRHFSLRDELAERWDAFYAAL